jgi:pilus assembly protein CpaF
MRDLTISEIMVNGAKNIFVEQSGRLQKSPVVFDDNDHVMKIVDRIVTFVGRRIDESSPMADARLADGSRVNIIIPPLALDGPTITIRRFPADPLTLDGLVGFKALSPGMAEFLKSIVRIGKNILISGGTGSGKTTSLNAMSAFIPATERIVTIEDAAELQLQQDHVIRLETRPANIEGNGEIGQRELVKNALRMRPDRIVIGEVRGAEAMDMLQAMNTGHDGSLTTTHANTPRDALSRIENMVAMAGFELPMKAVRAQIASAIHYVVQVTRLEDGSRRMTNISEVNGMEGDIITMTEIFSFERHGLDENYKILGAYKPSGAIPMCTEELKHKGIILDNKFFDPENAVEG